MSTQNIVNQRQAQMLESNMGPQLMGYMHDENITELMLNPDGHLWIDTQDKGCIDSGVIIDPRTAKQIIYNVGALSGRVIPNDFPELEAEIPKTYLFDSCRFQAELPPVVKAPSFNIRKFGKKLFTLDDYVEQGTMTERQRDIIMDAIAAFKIPEFLNNSKEAKAAQLTATVGSLISQYKMEIGTYPDSLDDLTKENGQYGPWLKAVPRDPFDGGKELQYMKDTSNYAVYSIGKNGSSDSSASSIGGDDIGFTGK